MIIFHLQIDLFEDSIQFGFGLGERDNLRSLDTTAWRWRKSFNDGTTFGMPIDYLHQSSAGNYSGKKMLTVPVLPESLAPFEPYVLINHRTAIERLTRSFAAVIKHHSPQVYVGKHLTKQFTKQTKHLTSVLYNNCFQCQ